jgi:hypothetical protein
MTEVVDIKKAIRSYLSSNIKKQMAIENRIIGHYLDRNACYISDVAIIKYYLADDPDVEEIWQLFDIRDTKQNREEFYQMLLDCLDKRRIAVKVWRKRNNSSAFMNDYDVELGVFYLMYQDPRHALSDEYAIVRKEMVKNAMTKVFFSHKLYQTRQDILKRVEKVAVEDKDWDKNPGIKATGELQDISKEVVDAVLDTLKLTMHDIIYEAVGLGWFESKDSLIIRDMSWVAYEIVEKLAIEARLGASDYLYYR